MSNYQKENEQGRKALADAYDILWKAYNDPSKTPDDWVVLATTVEEKLDLWLLLAGNPLTNKVFDTETIEHLEKLKNLVKEMKGEEEYEESSDS